MTLIRDQFKRTPFDSEEEANKKIAEAKKKEDEENTQNELKLLKYSFNKLLDEKLEGDKSKKKQGEITISIQLLIMHYLGFLKIGELKNKEKALLLSVIFGTEGHENIRRFLSNVGGKDSPLLERKNLLYIEDLFKRLGMEEQLQKVQKDLAKKPANTEV